MKNNLIALVVFILMLLIPTDVKTDTTTGGDVALPAVPDSTAIARDDSRPPTADITWANKALNNVSSLELDDTTNSMLLRPDLLGGVGALKLDFPSGPDFTFGQGFAFSLYLRSSSGPAFLNLMTTADDGTTDVGWSVVKDSALDGGGLEGVNVAWRTALSSYSIDTIAINGGTNFPLRLNANGGASGGAGTPSMTLATNGDVSVEAGQLLITDGLVGAPGIGFITQATTGLFKTGSGSMSFSSAGTERVRMNSTGIAMQNSAIIRNVDGTVLLPSYTFVSDLDSGIARTGADQVSITVGGSESIKTNNQVSGRAVVQINDILKLPPVDFTCTADNCAIDTLGANSVSNFIVTSDNATATLRTMTLVTATTPEEGSIIIFTKDDSTNGIEVLDSAASNTCLKGGTWTPVQGDILALQYLELAGESCYHEMYRAEVSGGVASHAASHLDGASDEVDVELMGAISTLTPAGYSPSTAETGCDATDQLCAHLKGIDDSLGMLADDLFSGTVTTTDATATLVSGAAFTVAEGETVLLDQRCSGVRTDGTAGSKGYASFFTAAFRRPSAGSAASIGTVVTQFEKADTPSAYSSQVDLTGNVVTPQVTGVASQTVNWECKISLNRVS